MRKNRDAAFVVDHEKIEALEAEAALKGTEAEIPDDLEGDMYLQFMDAIRRASAESEVADITTIGMAASRDWRAAAWRLERKFPTRYGKQSIEFSGFITPPNVVVNFVDPEEDETDPSSD